MNQSMRQGPALEALASKITVIGKKGKCAIILPVYDEINLLNGHLGILEKQAVPDFDVVIVFCQKSLDVSRIRKSSRFGTVTICMKEQLGAAAGYYAGELYALQNGYECVILADVDCVPLSSDLVRKLGDSVSDHPDCVISPVWEPFEGFRNKSLSLHWYGAMHPSLLRKAGLTFLPFYFGCLDSEHEARLLGKSGCKSKIYLDDGCVYHPISKNMGLGRSSERAIYDARNAGPTIFLHPLNVWFWFVGLVSLCSFCFCDSLANFAKRARAAIGLLRSMAMADYGPLPGNAPLPSYQEIKLEELPISAKRKTAIIIESHLGKEKARSLASSLSKKGFGCEVIGSKTETGFFFPLIESAIRCSISADAILVCISPKYLFSPFLLASKSLYAHDGEKTYVIYENKDVLSRILHFSVSMLSVALLSPVYLAISFISALRLKNSLDGYGLNNLKNDATPSLSSNL